LTRDYPFLTPYQFVSNRPIDGIDMDELEVIQYTLAKQGVYGPTAAKIINGTEKGVKASLKSVWSFFARDAWKAQTWINTGKFIEQGALSMSAVPVAPTPMVDAKTDEFINDVVRGDAYSRSAYISEFGTNIATGIIADKGISKLALLAKIGARTNLAKSWIIATDYIDFEKAVSTQTLSEGKTLYQYRIPGTDKGSYFVESLDITPEQVGLKSADYSEVYKVTLTQDAKVLKSTHKKDAPYWRDKSQTTEGGGQQIYNTEIKNTATFEKIEK